MLETTSARTYRKLSPFGAVNNELSKVSHGKNLKCRADQKVQNKDANVRFCQVEHMDPP